MPLEMKGQICTDVHALVLRHLKYFACILRRLNKSFDHGGLIYPWVDNMVSREPEAIISKYTRLSDLVVGSLHALCRMAS